jgi:hypothetical protein
LIKGDIPVKYVLTIVMTSLILLMSACKSGPLPEERIYVHLEQAVELEAEFENQQEQMVSLEQKEKELYDQIIALGLKELDKIKQLSTEAASVVEQRQVGLDKEYESILQSKAEFDQTFEIVKEIENEELKNEANALLELMSERYSVYEELYTAYSSAINLDKELYTMFQNKDLTLEQLEQQIEKINKSYEQVISLNETFNTLTNDYNNQKKLFYESSGLEVSMDEETPNK